MNINALAKRITELEGKKQEVNIAQIKEVLSCIQKICKQSQVNFYQIIKNIN